MIKWVLELFIFYFKQVPGNLEVAQVPQMVTLTFNGAINVDNIRIYQEVH